MMNKAMIVLIDGAATDYLTKSSAPNINKLATDTNGFYKIIDSQIPTVTNVNHARILTGKFPEVNGINGNVFFNKRTNEKTFIESPKYLNAPTIFAELKKQHLSSALLTVKGKIDEIFGQKATYRINAEKPDNDFLKSIGTKLPPRIDSLESGKWVVETAKQLIRSKSPDFVYATTNDYIMHHFSPDNPHARQFISQIDQQIAEIHQLEPDRTIYITADHGMNNKPTLINLQTFLNRQNFSTTVILPLADRYLKNHQYQESGAAYIYVSNPSDVDHVKIVVQQLPGIEKVLTRDEAVVNYHLNGQRIGDLLVFAAKDVAFGLQDKEVLKNYPGRSHGSLHELEVPLFCISNQETRPTEYETSRDLFNHLKQLLAF
ncbi:alkaline phosphatase family protein [Lentilactobacillus raoultii]|uniref:Alkaline phosphatase family protein n=1 Tax=Lentilactobacillus raoultii TaxID=1987503 RepID=A0ABW3PNY9_9LACO|nr:alkaline phosphatase family protein [Lentilactobacillus raoultii]